MADEQTGAYELSHVPHEHGACRAVIASVDPGSPADVAGLTPGMVLTEVEGAPLTDIIEWRWQADGFAVEVTLESGKTLALERELGQDWGLTFDDVIFDGLITCKNACSFCFMTMLHKGMRPTLYLRDDDYRLSFLQGNFVTLTNLSDAQVQRIIDYDLEPLHVSLHAVTPAVRERLIGKNASRGMKVLEQLLDAGLSVHVQLVVCPGVNDGLELVKTLSWVSQHEGVLSCGIVPLGYTRFSRHFTSSFSDDPAAAAEVIEIVREFQEDSGIERRNARLQVADEFYLDAGYDFPPARFYADYPQFQDGIGMMRSFIDEFSTLEEEVTAAARDLEGKASVTIVSGTAFARVLEGLIEKSPLASHVRILGVENRFFGGNVDVTGLLCGSDIVAALKEDAPEGPVVLSRTCFNFDERTLDDMTVSEIEQASGCKLRLCTYCADELVATLH
jgi:putative radical SAM enzyme (TIGR03279 family)